MEDNNNSVSEQLDEMSGRWIRDQLRDVANTEPVAFDADDEPPEPELPPVSEAEGTDSESHEPSFNGSTAPAPASTGLDLAVDTEPPSPNDADADDFEDQPVAAETSETSENAEQLSALAANLTQAVLEPIRSLERRRTADNHALSQEIHRATDRMEAAVETQSQTVDRVARVEDRLSEGDERLAHHREQLDTLAQQLEALTSDLRRDMEELSTNLTEIRREVEQGKERQQALDERLSAHETELAKLDRLDRVEEAFGDTLNRLADFAAGMQGAVAPLSKNTDDVVNPPEPEERQEETPVSFD